MSVDSLHVVESSKVSLHGMMVEFDNGLGIPVRILQIGSECAIVSLVAHEIGTEFEVEVVGEFFEDDAVYLALVVELADHE